MSVFTPEPQTDAPRVRALLSFSEAPVTPASAARMLLRACGPCQGPYASKLETTCSSQVSPTKMAEGGPLVLIKGRQMLPSSSSRAWLRAVLFALWLRCCVKTGAEWDGVLVFEC